jgi:hypothetical protein
MLAVVPHQTLYQEVDQKGNSIDLIAYYCKFSMKNALEDRTVLKWSRWLVKIKCVYGQSANDMQ